MTQTPLPPDALKKAMQAEALLLEKAYRYLEKHMPPSFLEEVDEVTRIVLARNLLSFPLQNFFAEIQIERRVFVLCWDKPAADVKILKRFSNRGILYYHTFVSNAPPPLEKKGLLRIAILHLGAPVEKEPMEEAQKKALFASAKAACPQLQETEFTNMLQGISSNFLSSIAPQRLQIALAMFFKAKTQDECQYEIRKNAQWKEKNAPSLQLIFAWRGVPRAGFLYRLAKIIHAHGLVLTKASGATIYPYQVDETLILSLGLHGMKGGAAWDEADIDDLLREICLLKYFEAEDAIATTFVQTGIVTGNIGHLIRNFVSFTHQTLIYADPYLYSFDSVVEGICYHPELIVDLCKLFAAKFDPNRQDPARFIKQEKEIEQLIESLDTGHAQNDLRRKNILRQILSFIQHTLKTNFYCQNKSAFSFRLNPDYLTHVPYNRQEKFPEIPFGIFFIRGMHFVGFNIRFTDLARGGVRTVTPEKWEHYFSERNTIFSEAYFLAYTQQKKNKDIPEGGAKTAILLKPFEVFASEIELYKTELEEKGIEPSIIEEKCKLFVREHKLSFLFASQRAFIKSLLTLINCKDDGQLKAKDVLDYYKKPEYIYLGPDENMLNDMIIWIANFSVQEGYKCASSFMSSKPKTGINHKEFGVTSYGVNVYLHQTLLYLGINPEKDLFTIKISGGPDGDVAGNEILNLYKFYPKTAKLLALTDVSGTIYDPEGLDLTAMVDLFHKGLPIHKYPAQKLAEGGFLLDLRTKQDSGTFAQQTLLLRKKNGVIIEQWLSGSEMNHIFRNNLHQVKTHAFIPGGGRPRTLNENNVNTYLDETGKPTSLAIVEGANLYLTPGARRSLETLGVLVLKDSSCNKGGVICSSFEVLAGLCLSDAEFLEHKERYVKEVLQIIYTASLNEANLLLETHRKTGQFLTDISEKISEKINFYKYQLLNHLVSIDLPKDKKNPLIKALFAYCPPLLCEKYPERILAMPQLHQKAIIACHLASNLIYTHGIECNSKISDIPKMTQDLVDRQVQNVKNQRS